MAPLGGQHVPRWTRWLSALPNVSGHDDALICDTTPGRTAETIRTALPARRVGAIDKLERAADLLPGFK